MIIDLLPVELTLHIFSFLSPCEIVRLRQVSGQFGDITHSSALWRRVYSNPRLLLPPGPLPSQSTRYLERTLVQSEIVSKTWTSRPLKVLRQTETSWEHVEFGGGCTVAFGRWCIFVERKTIQCHDIDTDTRHFLYDGTAHPTFWLSACTTSDSNDHRVYLLLVSNRPLQGLKRLLGFRVNDDGFSVPEIMDWTHTAPHLFDTWPWMTCFRGSVPFIIVRHHHPCVVLDIRTCCLHKLPDANIPGNIASELLWTLRLQSLDSYTHIVLTRTHVIAVRTYTGTMSPNTVPVLIQAFVVPDLAKLSDSNEVGDLRLTHEAIIRTAPRSFSLLRNSIVDPLTGSVNIRLLHTSNTMNEQACMSCLDLTLPKPAPTTDISPISIRSQQFFKFRWTSERHTFSDDGHVRGLLLTGLVLPDLPVISSRKFSIDATGEECIVEVGNTCPAFLPLNTDEVAFDGTRGRISFYRVVDNVGLAVTIDLA